MPDRVGIVLVELETGELLAAADGMAPGLEDDLVEVAGQSVDPGPLAGVRASAMKPTIAASLAVQGAQQTRPAVGPG